MTTPVDAAQVLAGRGATLELNDGDIVTDAVIVCRVEPGENAPKADSHVALGSTEGTGWLDQYGLIKAADLILCSDDWNAVDGE